MAEKIATRHAYGEALAEIGSDPKIVALDADVSSCTMSCMFAQKYPERFFNMGIAEADMIGAAAGLSTYGLRRSSMRLPCLWRGAAMTRSAIPSAIRT